MTKMNCFACKDCGCVLENPIMCPGNHNCVKCENCRGTNIELLRERPAGGPRGRTEPHSHARRGAPF